MDFIFQYQLKASVWYEFKDQPVSLTLTFFRKRKRKEL